MKQYLLGIIFFVGVVVGAGNKAQGTTCAFSVNGITNVCVGNSVTLSVSGSAGTWTASSGVATVTPGSSTSTTLTGVGVGTVLVTYNNGACTATATVTVNTQPGAILGALVVCVGSTVTLSDSPAGGAWSSAEAAQGSVDGTGNVYGVSGGTATISYAIGSCAATAIVTVNTQPTAITGTLTLCETFSTVLSDAVGGGTWSSFVPSVGTISSTGTVTAGTAGTTTISYVVTGCVPVTTIVTVNTQPASISGTLTTCVGHFTSLTDATGGGNWSSVSPAVGTVDGSGNVDGLSGGTTTISYTLGTCAATKVVTVIIPPGAINGSFSLCQTLSTTLTDAVGGGVWSSVTPLVGSISSIGTVTGGNNGTATISYTIAGCPAVSAIVTVNTQPAAITGTMTVCVGLATNLTDAVGGGGWTSLSTGVATVSPTGAVSGISAGTSVISYTIGSCWVTQIVTVNPVPTNILGTLVLCANTTTSLSDLTGSGTWSRSNTNVSLSGGVIVHGAAAGTTIITYTLPTGCMITSVVTINALPVFTTAASDPEGCAPSVSTTLTATVTSGTSPYAYTWSPATELAATTGSSVSASVTGTRTYIVTVTDGHLCANTGTVGVTVNPLPVAITGTRIVCDGSTTQLSDATGSGTWSSSAAGTASVASGGLVTGTSTVFGTATITYSLGTGCITTATVTVNPLPAAITGNLSVCTGFSTNLTDLTAGGTWSSSNTTHGTVSTTGQVTAASGITSPQTTTIVYMLLATGCNTSVVVTVNPLPAPITGTLSVCDGLTTTLADGGGGTWSSNTPGTASIGLPSSGTVLGSSAGTATITYTIGSGCYVTAVVTVNPLPVNITGPSELCQNNTIQLMDGTSGGSWSSSNTISATVNSTGLVLGANAGTTDIIYTLPTTSCSVFIPITVDPLPVVTATTSTNTICAGLPVTLSSVASVGTSPYSYSWTGPGGYSTTTQNPTISSILASGAGVYSVTVTDSKGCVSASPGTTAAVTVNPLPPAPTITVMPPASVCLNTMYQNFGANAPPAGQTYNWTATSGSVFGQSTSDHQNSVVNFTSAGSNTVTLTATITSTGCTNHTDKIIAVGGTSLAVDTAIYFESNLVCLQNNVTYLWGYDDQATLDSSLLPGDNTEQSYYLSALDVSKLYWVVTTSGSCYQKSYYYLSPGHKNPNTGGSNSSSVNVYPNPASGNYIDVQLDIFEPNSELRITDVLGREVVTEAIQDLLTKVDISALQPAVYFVACYHNGVKIANSSFVKK